MGLGGPGITAPIFAELELRLDITEEAAVETVASDSGARLGETERGGGLGIVLGGGMNTIEEINVSREPALAALTKVVFNPTYDGSGIVIRWMDVPPIVTGFGALLR